MFACHPHLTFVINPSAPSGPCNHLIFSMKGTKKLIPYRRKTIRNLIKLTYGLSASLIIAMGVINYMLPPR